MCVRLLQLLARVFSRSALESYLPGLQELIGGEVGRWCRGPGALAVFPATKRLTFRLATRVLLGLRLEEKRFAELGRTFEQLVENLFALPLNIPFSGLRKVWLAGGGGAKQLGSRWASSPFPPL